MDLDFTQEQELLRTTVRKLCEQTMTSETVREMECSSSGYAQPFWHSLSEMGVPGLLVNEKYNGVDMGMLDTVLIYEEFGRALAASPHFVSSVLAARFLQRGASEPLKQAWLSEIASGNKVVVPAWMEVGMSADISRVTMSSSVEGDTLILSGEKILVPFANCADALLVFFKFQDKLVAALVPRSCKGLTITAQMNHADENLCAISFDRCVISLGNCIGLDSSASEVESYWDKTMLEGLIALSAQAVGGAIKMQEMAVEYAKQRQQFGQPIGTFQSIAHSLADRETEIEGVRHLVYQAAWACDQNLPFEQLALMAKLQACAVYRRATVTGVQVHGGMGFSSEADPQLYYRRAKHQQLMFWDPSYLEQRIAEAVLN